MNGVPSRPAPDRPRTALRRFVLMAVLAGYAGSVAACAHLQREEAAPETPPPPMLVAASPAVQGDDEEEEPSWEARAMDQAEALLAAGHFEEASALYLAYLERTPTFVAGGEDRPATPVRKDDRALWGLALLHLIEDSPLHDPERAGEFLDRLAEKYPETVTGMQARWIRGLLHQLDEVRAKADQQQQLLIQLAETVDQLRRIDLNRRPTGSGADTTRSRGDTLPERW